MNAAVTLKSRAEGTPANAGRPSGVLAYVSDADSEAVLNRVAASLALPGFELRRGDIRMAERDLKTQRSPAVLLVDVSDTDTVLDAMQRLSEVCEPQLQVIVIGRQNDVGLFRALLGLGAADYLFKPLTAELVETVIVRLTSGGTRLVETRSGKLVAVTGARGGVGTSSIAVNIASYLARHPARRVALIDLDTRGGAQALLLGVQPNAGLAEALKTPARIDDLFLERATISVDTRLDLLASELPLGRAPAATDEGCATLLTRLRRGYHYVVVDMPHTVRDGFEPLLAEANVELIVLESTLLSVRDAARRLESAAGTRQRGLLVLNKVGRAGDLAEADVALALRRAPDLTIAYAPKSFGAGVNLGKPAWTTDARIEASIARLAREISGQAATTAAAAQPSRLQRLFGRAA